MTTVQTFGKVVRELRLQHGLTQLQLAELASVSERTIRSAEKSQMISCSHVHLIANALGVSASQIAPSPLAVPLSKKICPLRRIWEVMFGRVSLLSIHSQLHREVQIQTCGELPGIAMPEEIFGNHNGIRECMLLFERISKYFDSIGCSDVQDHELLRSQKVVALQGTVSPTLSSRISHSLCLVTFAVLEQNRIRLLVSEFTCMKSEKLESSTGPQTPTISSPGGEGLKFQEFFDCR